MGIFGAGLRSPITESLRRQPQSMNPQVFARRQESTLTPQRRTVGRVLADLITPKTREGAQWARKVSGALDWTSPTGADQPAQDAMAEFKKGNYGTSGLLGVLAAASLVPGVGTEAKTGKGLLGKFFEAYHGSPHKFDRFSLDKIGTGEGAQAYGHGLYFAENEKVAKKYRDDLVDPDQVPLHLNGKPIDEVWTEGIRKRFPEIYKGLPRSAGEDMDALLGTLAQENNPENIGSVLGSLGHKRYADLYHSRVEPFIGKPDLGPGSMYHVKINADPSTFLDWDKPLSAQGDLVKSVAMNADTSRAYNKTQTLIDWFRNGTEQPHMPATGKDLYHAISGYGENGDLAAKYLKDNGVPGIHYLDQNSRSLGEGTRNHVVFDDSLIEILKRYGIVPPALVGGMAAQQQNQMPQ